MRKKTLIDTELSNDLKNLCLKSLDNFRKKFIGTKNEHRWIIDFTKYILYINKGKAKNIYVLSPFYSKKESCIYDMFISKVDFIDDFKFADER